MRKQGCAGNLKNHPRSATTHDNFVWRDMTRSSILWTVRPSSRLDPRSHSMKKLDTTTALYLLIAAGVGLALWQVASSPTILSEAPRRSAVPIRQWLPGDTLPDATLTEGPSELPLTLSSVVRERCATIVFFQSTCAACHKIAPLWKGLESLMMGGDTLPVYWVSVGEVDSSGVAFRSQYQLPSRDLRMSAAEARNALGVTWWPTVYIVGPGGVLVRKPEALPNDIRQAALGCQATVQRYRGVN